MKWPLHDRAIPDRKLPLYNRFYLHASAATQSDPTLVWGTDIDVEALRTFMRERNRDGRVVITPIHMLIRAAALTLAQFPEMNARIVGRRVYAFRDVNIRMAFFHRRNLDIDLLRIANADRKSLEQIGTEVWQGLLNAGRNERGRDRDLARIRRLPGFVFRQLMRFYNFLDRHMRLPTLGRLEQTREGCVTVNNLSFSGAPPMRSYKPSRFPDLADSLNLTIGPTENKVVERDGHFVSVAVMPLFMRVDHRIVDAYQAGRFLGIVRDLLNDPQRLDAAAADRPAP
jgi:2-oxoacid dehydrogenases acyltransferase (catalytic domain)